MIGSPGSVHSGGTLYNEDTNSENEDIVKNIMASLFPSQNGFLTHEVTGDPFKDDHSGSNASNNDLNKPVGDNNGYGSDDISGWKQAYWALVEQWKMDEEERQYNSAEAQKQRDWEEMMSNTSVQRAVADIKAAGLNPWLALNGGSLGAASTPSGASASASSGSAKVPQSYTWQLVSTLISSASNLLGKLTKFATLV